MKKYKTILYLTFSFIIAISSILLFIYFMRVIKNKNEHISVVTATLAEKEKEKQDSITFAKKIAEIKTYQDSINGHFVDTKKIDMFVDYLEKVGTTLNSKISTKGIEMSTKNDGMISVKISITGSFSEVMKTISYLENIPYEINVTQIFFSKNTTPAAPAWQADVSFDILSLR